jgi:DNA-binding MarR family transcriptional regulator
MAYLQPSSYELPFASQSSTSRDAAQHARRFVCQQGADVLRWFIERGARGGTQKEVAAALGLGRPSVAARVHALEKCGWLIKSVSERRSGCACYYVTEA